MAFGGANSGHVNKQAVCASNVHESADYHTYPAGSCKFRGIQRGCHKILAADLARAHASHRTFGDFGVLLPESRATQETRNARHFRRFLKRRGRARVVAQCALISPFRVVFARVHAGGTLYSVMALH